MEKDFNLEWEKFINCFDAIEEMTLWDKNAYGEMEAFCENILISVLIHFVAVDGKVKPMEVEKLNKAFGFRLKFAQIENIYSNMSEEINDCIADPDGMLDIIAKANLKIAERFKELLVEACELIVNSDDFVDVRESTELSRFVENLKKC